MCGNLGGVVGAFALPFAFEQLQGHAFMLLAADDRLIVLGGTLYGMVKTTVYLPDDLEVRLDAEAAATGVSKAELIRRGVDMVLEASQRPKRSQPLPVFDSGRSRTVDEMDDAVYDHVKQRAARR